MKRILLVAAVAAAGIANANEKQYLWPKDKMPDRQGHQIAALTCDSEAPGFVRAENTEPFIECMTVPQVRRRMMFASFSSPEAGIITSVTSGW